MSRQRGRCGCSLRSICAFSTTPGAQLVFPRGAASGTGLAAAVPMGSACVTLGIPMILRDDRRCAATGNAQSRPWHRVGTSGVRAAAVDETGLRVAFAAVKMTVPLDRGGLVTQDPAIWWEATRRVFQRLSRQIELKGIGAIAVTGTSGTILGVHANGRPVAPAQMYNSQASAKILRRIAAVAPAETVARGPTSALARAIVLQKEPGVTRVIDQADWISGQFLGRFDLTDENNALKTGYDAVTRRWPNWLIKAGMDEPAPHGRAGRHHYRQD